MGDGRQTWTNIERVQMAQNREDSQGNTITHQTSLYATTRHTYRRGITIVRVYIAKRVYGTSLERHVRANFLFGAISGIP